MPSTRFCSTLSHPASCDDLLIATPLLAPYLWTMWWSFAILILLSSSWSASSWISLGRDIRSPHKLCQVLGRAYPVHQPHHGVHWHDACLPGCFLPSPVLGPPYLPSEGPPSHLMPLIDKLLRKLATWKVTLLTRGERLALVRQVLSAMHVHILLAMALSPPILKKANRIIRDFLWHDRKDTRAGSGLVSWACVCSPLEIGGLGIRDLHRVGISLLVRWLWLQATDHARP